MDLFKNSRIKIRSLISKGKNMNSEKTLNPHIHSAHVLSTNHMPGAVLGKEDTAAQIKILLSELTVW